MAELFPDNSYQEALKHNKKWHEIFQTQPLNGPYWSINLDLHGQLAYSNVAKLPLDAQVSNMLDEIYELWGVRRNELMKVDKRGGLQEDVCMPTSAGFMVVEHHHFDRAELVVSLSCGLPPAGTVEIDH